MVAEKRPLWRELLLPKSLPEVMADRTGVGLLFVTQTVLLCPGLAVVVYRQRVLAYRARRSLEELRETHASLLVAESAHAQARFAAAMSHELHTPLGALASAFETVISAHRRQDSLPRERVERVLSDAEASGRASVARIRETLERMRFLSNLDRAEEQTLDLERLVSGTGLACRRKLGQGGLCSKIAWNLHPVFHINPGCIEVQTVYPPWI